MFKKLFITIVASASVLCAQDADTLHVSVDKRMELLSVVAKLADYPEYAGSTSDESGYVEAIDKHFAAAKNHPLVSYARELRQKQSIAYDAIPSLAVSLKQPPQISLLTTWENVSDKRWNKESIERFTGLLQQFYVDARCGQFLADNKSRYESLEQLAREKLGDHVDIKWVKHYYNSKGPDSFHLIVSPLCGIDHSYGTFATLADGTKAAYAVTGYQTSQDERKLVYQIITTLNFPYAYSLIQQHSEMLEEPAKKFMSVSKAMNQAALKDTWMSYLAKSFVSAVGIRYMLDHGASEDDCQTVLQAGVEKGFIFLPRLVALLGDYEQHRDKYPAFGDFMPKIGEFFRKYDQLLPSPAAPHVIRIAEFSNGSTSVDPELGQITLQFDQPMMTDRYSVYVNNADASAPPIKSAKFTDANTFVIKLGELKPGHSYRFTAKGKDANFKSAVGVPLIDYIVNFTTSSAKQK